MNDRRRSILLRGCVLLPVVVVLGFRVPPAGGQTKPEPQPGRTVVIPGDSTVDSGRRDSAGARVRYPSFDIPEYTITGDALNAFQRAPRPFATDYAGSGTARSSGPGVRDIGTAFSASRTPGLIGAGNRFAAGVRMKYGSFRSPGLDGWIGNDFGDADILLVSGFASSGGHVDHADFQKAYNALSGGFGVGGARVRARLGLNGDGYRLYGSPTPARWRTVTDLTGDVDVHALRIGTARVAAGMHLRSTAAEDSTRAKETQLGFDLSYRGDIGPVTVRSQAQIWSSAYSVVVPSANPLLTMLQVRARSIPRGGWDLEAGFNAVARRGSDAGTLSWIDPVFGVYWHGWSDMTLFMRFEPGVQWMSLATLMQKIPYASLASPIRPGHYPTDLKMGVEFRPVREMRMSVTLRHLRGEDLPVAGDPSPDGAWIPRYDGVLRSTGVTADLSVDLSASDLLQASVSIRKSSWSRTDAPVPYYPDFEADVMSMHRFPFGLGVSPTLHLVGGRVVAFDNTRTLPGYLDIGVRAEYIVLPSLHLVFSVGNLFGADRTMWEGYAGVPRTADMSMQYSW